MPSALQSLRKARELLAEPSRWTQGAYARDGCKQPVSAVARSAQCWCLAGAIHRSTMVTSDYGKAHFHLSVRAREFGRGSISTFNDHPDTTHADILRVLDETIARLRNG